MKRQINTKLKLFLIIFSILDNQYIDVANCQDEINGWELVELNEIKGYKKSNIFNKQKPFAVMFEFFCQAKLYVVATEIEFNRI